MAYSRSLPKPLSKEREALLLECSAKGDEGAREELIKHNIRLVIHVANRYRTRFFDEEDISSVGTIGLIKAVRTFQSDKNTKFATYASRCIENEILMLLRQIKKRDKEDSYESAVSFDSEGNELSVMDTLGSEKDAIEDEMLFKEEATRLKKIVYELPEKEKEIILYRFGLDRERIGQTEIAKRMKVSQSYISRVEKKILKKIKTLYQKEHA